MADGTTLNRGTGGDTIAADEISGKKYQRIKLGFGADGTYTGDTSSTNRFPMAARAATTDTVTAKVATDAIQNGTTALTPKFKVISVANSGNNTLIAAVASKKIRVLAMVLIGAGTIVTFKDGTSGSAISGALDMQNVAAFVLDFSPGGWFETSVNTLLNMNTSDATAVTGFLVYVEV